MSEEVLTRSGIGRFSVPVNIARQVGKVAFGTALGQGSVLAVTPVLARIYSPAEFGELALFLTVAAYAAAAGCLRYDLALARSSKDEAPALFWLCALSALGVALVVGLLAWIPWEHWTDSQLVVALASHPLLLSFAVAAVGLHQAVSSELVRAADFARLAVLRALQGILFAGAALLTVIGLVVAVPASYAGAVVLALRKVPRVPVRHIVAAAGRYRSFALLSLPGALFDALACSAAVLLISTGYGLVEVGHFSQIQRFLGAPLLLVSASLFQVFLRQSADAFQAGRPLTPLLMHIGTRVAALVALALLAVLAVGEPLLGFLLGHEWRVDRYFLLTVVGGLAVRVTVSPFSSILFTTGRLRTLFTWQLAYFVTSFVVLSFAANRLDFDRFLAVYLLHETVLYAVYMSLIVRAARAATKA